MHKQFISITLLVTIITMLLFTSCSAPVVAPTTTPKVTPAPTPVVTATPLPTATPRTEPYSPDECENILEAITGTDVTYAPMKLLDSSLYHYKDETHLYGINRLNGKFAIYTKNTFDSSTSQLVNVNGLEQIAVDEINKYCPSLFDLEVEVKINSSSDKHRVYLYQLSPIHCRRTGNNANVTIQPNGEIFGISVHNNEDPTIADMPLKINREQAIEIAYIEAQKTIDKMFENPEMPKFDVFLDERETQELEVIFTVGKGRPLWMIEIDNIRNNEFKEHGIDHPMHMNVTIFADTGEAEEVGHS